MRLERRQVHLQIEHTIYKVGHLRLGHIGETGNEEVRHVLPQEGGVGLAGWSGRRVEQWNGYLVHLHQVEHVTEKSSVHFEARLVQTVRHHRKDILDQGKQILLVETLRHVRSLPDIGEQLVENLQTSVLNVSLGMFHRPDHRIYHELLVLRRDVEESWEALQIDGAKELEKSNPMLGKILKVLRDHLQRALKHGLHYPRYIILNMTLELLNHSCKEGEDLRIAGTGNVPLVIAKDGIQHRRDEALSHCARFSLRRTTLIDKHNQKPQDLLLCASHGASKTHLRGDRTLLSNRRRYALRIHLVNVEHVQKEGLELMREERTDRVAYSIIHLQNLDNLLDRTGLNEALHIGSSLVHNDAPRLVGKLHELGLEGRPIDRYRRSPVVQHAADGFVKGLDLMRFQIANDAGEGIDQLADERCSFIGLHGNKLPLALRRDLEESIARHVLNTGMTLVHKFK
mmetsp:Transcript_29229/g.84962  ORF Transcript_29229/g.84962 Transcript_29229/m.84962 type:complete len:456 (+) Transcript_29229:341-1708(+)